MPSITRPWRLKTSCSADLKFRLFRRASMYCPILTEFLKNNPGVEISIDVTNREKVFQSLEDNEVDFSLISTDINSPAYDYIDILENELYLVGNQATAALKPKFVFQEFNKELPLIFREKGSGTRKIMESYLKNREFMP